MDLTNKHPDYIRTAPSRRKSRDLYEGTARVQARGERYLFREKNEDLEQYQFRLKRAVLDNYVEKIVEARHALLFKNQHSRDLGPLENIEDNVDRRGTSAETFFADAARHAAIDGISWVVVDMPRVPPGGYKSRKEEQTTGHRPFFAHAAAEAVLDWAVDENGALEWVVIEQESLDQRAGWGLPHETKPQWKVWTKTEWILYERSESDFVETDRGAHGLGMVPVVPFYGIRCGDFCGWPVAHSVLDHVILLYNKSSDMDWFERLAAHPIPVVIAPEKPIKLDTNSGLFISSGRSEGAPISVEYLEISGASFGQLRESITDIRRSIVSIALGQSLKDTAQVQSADSQREDRHSFDSSVKSTSVHLEHSEQACWRLAAKWWGQSEENIHIGYSRDFDDTSIETAMLDVLLRAADSGRLSDETYLAILQQSEVLPEGITAEEELARIRKQQTEAQASATLSALESLRRARIPEPEEEDLEE